MVVFESDIDWGRAAWIAAGAVLALGVVWVLYSFVGTFVFALFIYYSTRRVHGHIRRRVGQPSLSAALALLALALPGVLLLFYATAIALQEFQAFADGTEFGELSALVGPYLDASQAVEDPASLIDRAGGTDVLGTVLSELTAYLGLIGTGLLHLFVMFAVAFYLLRDDHLLAAWFRRLDADGGVLEEYARAVDTSLEKIFAGNILNAVVTGTVGAISYSVLNLVAPDAVAIPYAALVGLLAGFASLIPVVGMKLVYVPVTIYLGSVAYTEGTGFGFVALFAAVSFVVVDVVPDFFVRPFVTGGSLHTGSLMFAYILGPLLFGWYGLFLAPMILVFVTHFAAIVLPELVDPRPDRPGGIDPPYLPTSVAAVERSLRDESDGSDARTDDSDRTTDAPEGQPGEPHRSAPDRE
jgi:predicted PurR-regulated permease PerM